MSITNATLPAWTQIQRNGQVVFMVHEDGKDIAMLHVDSCEGEDTMACLATTRFPRGMAMWHRASTDTKMYRHLLTVTDVALSRCTAEQRPRLEALEGCLRIAYAHAREADGQS